MNAISVRGGVGGVEARCDDMVAAARLFGNAASDTGGQAFALHGYLLHPVVAASAALDPAGVACFEAALADALDGPHGVSLLAVRCAGLDAGLRAAAAAYLGADRLDERFAPDLDLLANLPHTVDRSGGRLLHGDLSGAGQGLLTGDPQLADLAVGGVAGLFAGQVPLGSSAMGGLFADGIPVVSPLGPDPVADDSGPPRSLADVVAGLDRRNRGGDGEIDVRLLDRPRGGRRHVIVDIPGTKDWSLARHNDDITSLATNLRALGGETTSYERGVLEAMRLAGVRPDDDVLLVGHSEGGLVAVDTAAHLARNPGFHVTHVVTAGAPIGGIVGRVPSSVQVLAMENESDVVAHLDDAENPDRANVVTVGVRRGKSAILASHDLHGSYLPGAGDVDASADASVRAYLAGLGGFLGASRVRTVTYQVTRAYR